MKYVEAFILAAVLTFATVLFIQPSTQAFDFAAWSGTYNVSESSGLYDAEALNVELAKNPEVYGGWWAESPEDYELQYFNPPSWITTLKVVTNMNPQIFVAVSVFTFMLALCLFMIPLEIGDKTGFFALFILFFGLGEGRRSLELGQAGVFLAGLVMMVMWFAQRESKWAGVPLGLMTFKPHVAAAVVPSLLFGSKSRMATVVSASVFTVLVAASSLMFGVGSWVEWIETMLSSDLVSTVKGDTSFRTILFSSPVADSWNVIGVGVALVCAFAVSALCRRTDAAKVALFSLALMVFLSGHAFVHDWLWVIALPVMFGNFRLKLTFVTLVLFQVMSWVSLHESDYEILQTVSIPSLLALILTGFLGWRVVRQEMVRKSMELDDSRVSLRGKMV